MGMTPRQLLRQVELPLALPSIVAGIRVAAVVGVGSATIAAAIGAGGLGEYIFRGLSMVDTTVILAGADSGGGAGAGRRRRAAVARAAAVARGGGRVAARGAAVAAVARRRRARCRARRGRAGRRGAIVVGSKNFTEQMMLGELLAQTIERDAGLPVERRLNLGGTLICDRALLTGDIDVYVEYTGTALTAVFHQPRRNDPRAVFDDGARRCTRDSGRTLLPPLGFNNTFAILVRGARRARAAACGRSTTRRASRRAGAPASATSSSSGRTAIRAWRRRTACAFAAPPRVMDLTLIYRALASGQVDLIAGDATAGLIKASISSSSRTTATTSRPTTPCRWRARRRCCGIRSVRAALERLARPHLGRRHARDEPRRRCGASRTRTRSHGASLTDSDRPTTLDEASFP